MRNVEIEMNETANISSQNSAENAAEYKAAEILSKEFYLFAALQFFTIPCGAVLGLFVAPASLFASRTQGDEILALAAALAGISFAAFALIAFPLALAAAFGIKRRSRYGRICGIAAAVLAIPQIPLGTIIGWLLLRKIFKGENRK